MSIHADARYLIKILELQTHFYFHSSEDHKPDKLSVSDVGYFEHIR